MNDSYKTIANEGEGYYTEKRSKFLAFAHHVENVDEVKDIVARYRKEYYDARHVCYAYMLGAERTDFRSNDDGDPSSTAGKPILGQINARELTDVLLVVVRYYGGVSSWPIVRQPPMPSTIVRWRSVLWSRSSPSIFPM